MMRVIAAGASTRGTKTSSLCHSTSGGRRGIVMPLPQTETPGRLFTGPILRTRNAHDRTEGAPFSGSWKRPVSICTRARFCARGTLLRTATGTRSHSCGGLRCGKITEFVRDEFEKLKEPVEKNCHFRMLISDLGIGGDCASCRGSQSRHAWKSVF